TKAWVQIAATGITVNQATGEVALEWNTPVGYRSVFGYEIRGRVNLTDTGWVPLTVLGASIRDAPGALGASLNSRVGIETFHFFTVWAEVDPTP
ncbi:MAG: hypothetical protein LBW77_03180, partial [Verrucomicrobiota bacterium]|nr:hypothetical protein [Verrucomicrobiota bacterium]